MASAANPTLPDRFLTFINPQSLPVLSAPALLAVSGGLDSVVLAHLFHNAGFRFAIAHVNFQLRGDESDGDARFVEQLARQYGVPFYLTQVETARFADQTGISIQMAARTLRYDWFEQIRNQQGYTCVATAHHRNDVLETLLLNLTRGTGLAGLHGIAFRQGNLIRPLLFADRAELEAYAEEHHLTWREDQSNSSDYYARNRIRHQVVPVLAGINPNLFHTLNATLDRLRAAETLVQQELDRTARLVVKTTGEVTQIDLISLHTLTEPVFRLADWLQPFGFSYQQTTAIWQAISQRSGQEFGSATHRLIHERNTLILSRRTIVSTPTDEPIVLYALPEEPVFITDSLRLLIRCFDKPTGFVPPANPLIASFDADKLAWPLVVRRWRAGDRFRPLGLNGRKLVSDMLADQKVPRLDREQIRVLLTDNRIAWVIGQRTDHYFRITARTRRIVQVEPWGN